MISLFAINGCNNNNLKQIIHHTRQSQFTWTLGALLSTWGALLETQTQHCRAHADVRQTSGPSHTRRSHPTEASLSATRLLHTLRCSPCVAAQTTRNWRNTTRPWDLAQAWSSSSPNWWRLDSGLTPHEKWRTWYPFGDLAGTPRLSAFQPKASTRSSPLCRETPPARRNTRGA